VKFCKPDGDIEFGFSSCCCPPGQRRPGQHTNSSTFWFRIIRPSQPPQPWRRARTFSGSNVLADAARSCDEFLEAMSPDA
jgi:hypothetical protein